MAEPKLMIEDGQLRGTLITDNGEMVRWETNDAPEADAEPFVVLTDSEMGSSIVYATGEELVEMASGLIQLAGTSPLPAVRQIRDKLNAILEAHGVEL